MGKTYPSASLLKECLMPFASKTISPISLSSYIIINLVLAIIFLIIDSFLPLGVAGGVPYVLLVLVATGSRNRGVTIASAAIGTVFTVIGFSISPPGEEWWFALLNRSLAVFMIWMTAYFCLKEIHWANEILKRKELERAYELLKLESGFVQLNRDIAFETNMSQSVENAIAYSLKRICQGTGWPLGHFYLLGSDGSKLIPTKIWYSNDSQNFQKFIKITEETQFSEGTGLPGRVLLDGKAHWVTDVEKDPNFPRAAMEEEIGIRSGFAFPILIGLQTVGVMEFFSEKTVAPDKRLLEVMESIGTLLGRVLERYKADQEKKDYSDHLRKLYHKLDSIREEESKRMAREVHDGLGQVLTTLKIELSLLNKKLIEQNLDHIEENMEIIGGLIESTIQAVKKISLELRPPILDSLSLTEAIDWQGHLFQNRTGIQFTLSHPGETISLDPQRVTTLFRIFQECLTNIARHSEATKIHVDIIDQGHLLIMRVKDNGKGITPERIHDKTSLGILGMKERAQMWEGEVEIKGERNKGTEILIKLKY